MNSNPQTLANLVFQTAFLGDVLLGIPLLKALRARNPSHRLILACRKGVGSFFIDTGLVDEVIEIDKKSKTGWADAKTRLKSLNLDLLICPHESFRSSLVVSGLKAKTKIGYRRFFNFFAFDIRVRRPLTVPESLRQLALLAPIEPKWQKLIDDFESKQLAPGGQGVGGKLVAVPEEASMVVDYFRELRGKKQANADFDVSPVIEPIANNREPIVVLAPGSVWRTKMWTKEGFIQTAQEFSKKWGALTVISGSKDEMALCEEIASAIPNSVSIAGRTSLFESTELLAVADLLICNDSGAMHLGATTGIPTVSVFGPTVLEFGYRPWNDRAHVVQIALPCRPCGKHGAQKCPIGTHACMRDIPASMVISAANELLAKKP